jgi:restriction-modification enzyme MmeI-like protein
MLRTDMPLSWNEIRHNAIRFSREWADSRRESSEKQSFWNEFFEVFGIRRKLVASFEEPVKKISGDYGFIDLFWPGVLLVEHKSAGGNLGKAESQAFRYISDLARAGRYDDAPRYVIVSDFARIAIHDLEPEDQRDLPLFDRFRVASLEFPLAEFHKHIHAFAFIPGYKQHRFEEQDPINIKAVEILGDFHDALEAGGYSGHQLERFLVRVLFCLFAEDTGIFERDAFRLYLENRTAADGSDLGSHLPRLFDVLNTPEDGRQRNLDEELVRFRYVNGDLFAEHLGFADFNRDMRNTLLACTRFDWSRISPAIFGSLFQAVMEPKERRQIGGHYTSERDILKVARALFLDDLSAELDRIKTNKPELRRFHQKLARLRFLDPACGCGNFLVITYRELRLLEIEVLRALRGSVQQELDIQNLSLVDVDAFYGIEISEWPTRIAEVAMWLMDHQMNLRLSEAFGQYFVRLPLKKSPTIVCGNALRLDWNQILPPEQCSYVLGNPPFVGKKEQSAEQKADMDVVWQDVKGAGVLDFVTAWYRLAADYIQNTEIKVAFVSTNSISQGEQVSVLWGHLLSRYRVKIHFAHRTFAWESEARGKAHVHVVIIGFAIKNMPEKRLYDYETDTRNPVVSIVSNISPYLIEGSDIVASKRSTSIADVPPMVFGTKVVDDGHFVLDSTERVDLEREYPHISRYIRPFMGGEEFLNGRKRWVLWLTDASPNDLRTCPPVMERIEQVRAFRAASKKGPTVALAMTPSAIGEDRQPLSDYLLFPKVSSERRHYIPLGFLSKNIVANGSALVVPDANIYHFGVLSSRMHMAWMRQVCGRMKSDYQYSVSIVYNNYPWPENPTAKQRVSVESTARAVLDVRAGYLNQGSSLADLYDPLSMPPRLAISHADLDRAVDLCYRPQPFSSERLRVEFLFARYEELTAPLLPTTKSRRRTKR